MRFLSLVLRSLAILAVLTGAFFRYMGRRIVAGRLDTEARDHLRGQVLVSTLDKLGATYVKLGQILSTRPDIIPPGIVRELETLQDKVQPIPFEQVVRVLDEDLPKEARARIVSIDPVPVAAASVAQVHRGRLDTGEAVALKVQRPLAAPQIDRDLVLMDVGARMLEWIPSLKLLSLRGAVAQFAEAMHRQVDFEQEANNNRRFAANFAHVEGVEVPKLIDGLCSRRVLTMEFVNGVRATEPEKVGGDRKLLALRGAAAIQQMVFKDGFVHADLHPGNIMLTDEGVVVLIDLGLVAEIPKDLMRPFIETFHALSQKDGKAAARLFYVYAPTVGTKDYAQYEREVTAYFDTFYGKPLGELEASEVVAGIMNILRRHKVQIDPSFTVVHIAMLVAEGLGKQLDPDIDLIALATPMLLEVIVTAPAGRPPEREVPGEAEAKRAAEAAKAQRKAERRAQQQQQAE
jgi:ubiquinone biosynthesis protein